MQQYLLQLLGDLGLQGEALPSGEVLVVPRACQTPRLLFLAHHDEVGFLIRQVEGEYAWLDPIGSVGLEMLSSASLDIHTVNGVVRGILHAGESSVQGAITTGPSQATKSGAPFVELLPHEAVLEDVQVGDPVTFTPTYVEAGNKVVSKALDNRVGVYAILKALEGIDVEELQVAVVFSAAEELGGTSCSQLLRRVDPSIVVNVDATICGDMPNGDLEITDVMQGYGVVLKSRDARTVASVPLLRAVTAVAAARGIQTQAEALSRGGTDAYGVMLGSGAPTVNLGIPVRNLHTPRETVHRDDIEQAAQLLVALAQEGPQLLDSVTVRK